jgi:hypothetical protein
VAIRLMKQLKRVVLIINKEVRAYNAVGCLAISLPIRLTFEEVKSFDQQFWQHSALMPSVALPTGRLPVPVNVKRQAIELQSVLTRCAEEVELVKQEMGATLCWFYNQHEVIIDALDLNVSSGVKSVLTREALALEIRLQQIHSMFETHLGQCDAPPTTIITHLGILSNSDTDVDQVFKLLKDLEAIPENHNLDDDREVEENDESGDDMLDESDNDTLDESEDDEDQEDDYN